jgi:hypothetical protein
MSNLFSLPIKIPGLGLYKVSLKSAIYKMIWSVLLLYFIYMRATI